MDAARPIAAPKPLVPHLPLPPLQPLLLPALVGRRGALELAAAPSLVVHPPSPASRAVEAAASAAAVEGWPSFNRRFASLL
jgi:hypothetical protein